MKQMFAMAVAAAMAAAPAVAGRTKADLLIRHATIIDVATGKTTVGQAIAVKGDGIVEVGADAALARRYAATQNIDASGKFVMPGLWDMHVHFGGGTELIEENRNLLPLYVAHGVTTVRDAAADLATSVLAWRGQVAAGTLLGPTIFTSGPKLEGYKPLWKGTIEVGTPAEVDAALDRLQAMKVDFVKITDNTLKPEIFAYALKAAKVRGLKTSAHTPFAFTPRYGLAAWHCAGLRLVDTTWAYSISPVARRNRRPWAPPYRDRRRSPVLERYLPELWTDGNAQRTTWQRFCQVKQ